MPHMGEYSKAHAIADLFSRIKTGSYTGDNETTHAITGLGFQPKMLWIFIRPTAEGAAPDTYWLKLNTNWGDYCAYIAAATAHVDSRINSLDSDGFTVDDDGSNAHPNKEAIVYDYVAFR